MRRRSGARRWRLGHVIVPIAFTAAIVAVSAGPAAADSSPQITSDPSASVVVGGSLAFTFTTAGSPTPSLSETGALPSGVTFTDNGDGTASLAGTPADGTAGTYPLVLDASNGVAPDGTQDFTLTVDQAPAITSAAGASFTEGSPGLFTVTSSGTPTPSLSETGGLPSGVSFVDNGDGTATLSGTPAVGSHGSYPLTIDASNGISPDATEDFTLDVLAQATVAVTVSPVSVSGPVTFGIVTTGAVGVPTGSVTVSDGNGGTCTTTLSSGQGSCAITEAAGDGGFTATASYTGDADYGAAQQSVDVGTNVSEGGEASAVSDDVNITAINGTDGVDAVTVAEYPTYPAPITGGTGYFMVGESPGGNFSSMLVTDCDATNANTLLEWWDVAAGGWEPVAGDPGPTAKHNQGVHCVSVAFDDSSSPTLADVGNVVLANVTYSRSTKPPTYRGIHSAKFQVGKEHTVTLAVAGTPKPMIGEVGTLPSGVTFVPEANGKAELTGKATTGSDGSYPITLVFANGAGTLRVPFTVNVP